MNFYIGLEINACRSVEKAFPARLPPKGRSKRDTPVGVLVGQNGGRRKLLLAAGCSDDNCGFREAS